MSARADMQLPSLGVQSWPFEISDFAAGDVDGDGDLDLVGAQASGNILWRNAGDGSFAAPVTAGGGGRCVALVDLDGDGDLDTVSGGGRAVYGGAWPSSIWRNDGLGSFSWSQWFDSMNVQSLGVGDMDGDGDRDVIVFGQFSNSGTAIHFWRNDGTGTLIDATTAAFPGDASQDARGTLADVDCDGDLDVLAVNPGRLYRNSGSGVFTLDPNWTIAATDAADVDGDGDADLVFADGIMRNDGTGNFSGSGTPSPTWGSNRTCAADVDGDGAVDLVSAFGAFVPASTAPQLLRNLGGDVFQPVSATWFEPHVFEVRTKGYHWLAMLVFDADGDGRPDLVTGGVEGRNTTSTTVGIPPRLFLNAGGQRFVDAGRGPLPMLQETASALAAGDLDANGHVDLVFGYDGYYLPQRSCEVFLQDRAGRFATAGTYPLPFLSAMVLLDIDGDRDLDLFGAQGRRLLPGPVGRHQLLRNDGTGHFTSIGATNLPTSAASSGASCTAGDLDGDGDQDVVVGSWNPMGLPGPGAPLMLLRNNGAGVFTDASPRLPATLVDPAYLACADFDGDGDLDLAAGSPAWYQPPTPNYRVWMFVNDGAGNFVDATAARMPPATSWGMTVLDLDRDGDLDLAQQGMDLLNDGTGVFTAVAGSGTETRADFDEDGVADSVQNASNFGILGSPFTFSELGAGAVQSWPLDLDRDQDLDLVVLPDYLCCQPDWTTLRIEAFYNLSRDLRVASLPRLGKPYRLALRASNQGAPTAALVAVSVGALSPPVALSGLGDLAVDPNAIVLLSFTVVPNADTAVEVSAVVPASPTLFGLPLCAQALFGNGPGGNAAHLSNAMTFTIEY